MEPAPLDPFQESPAEASRRIYHLAVVAVIVWTTLFVLSYLWEYRHLKNQFIGEAASVARSTLAKDIAFRAWATKHGGVYVPVTNDTPPNPYLTHVPERDITTPSGRLLTLLNPAYALRQIMDVYGSLYGVRGHITSLKLMNPMNAPAEWEKRGLNALERGADEFLEIGEDASPPTLHIMRPMITTEGCLKCHGSQGYKVGDIRGGVSVSLDLTPYLEAREAHLRQSGIILFVIWSVGLGGIGYAVRWSRRRAIERARAVNETRINQERLNSMLSLFHMEGVSDDALLSFALEEIVKLTGSDIGYLHVVDSSGETISQSYWSQDTLETCSAQKGHDLRLNQAGIWADSVRLRAPVIHNDYSGDPRRKGLPVGHSPLIRHMSVPVWDGGHVVAVAGVGNKKSDYDDVDTRQVSLYLNTVWNLIRKRHDKAERADLQQQLVQARRLESIGRLAGGVAHDFNNYLSVILGYAEMGLQMPNRDRSLDAHLIQIMDAGQKAAGITRQLLAFSRKQTLEIRVVNVNQLIEGLAKLLRKTLGDHIALSVSAFPSLWTAAVDAVQIEQVIMNLVLNARDAMPDGGTLTIETANVTFDAGYAQTHPGFQPGRYIMISVSDTGTGISREDQDHVFEPFFTTKEMGKGTGLGLATVHGIVEQHKGRIHLYSEPGQGTTFRIYLPATDLAPEMTPVDAQPNLMPRIRAALVVDDEPELRQLLGNIFDAWGIRNYLAGDAHEALALTSEHAGEIDLLITDLVMPGMSGSELAQRFTRLCPGAATFIMSGYPADTLRSRGVSVEGIQYLQKPITPKELLKKLLAVFPPDRSASPPVT